MKIKKKRSRSLTNSTKILQTDFNILRAFNFQPCILKRGKTLPVTYMQKQLLSSI